MYKKEKKMLVLYDNIEVVHFDKIIQGETNLYIALGSEFEVGVS